MVCCNYQSFVYSYILLLKAETCSISSSFFVFLFLLLQRAVSAIPSGCCKERLTCCFLWCQSYTIATTIILVPNNDIYIVRINGGSRLKCHLIKGHFIWTEIHLVIIRSKGDQLVLNGLQIKGKD